MARSGGRVAGSLILTLRSPGLTSSPPVVSSVAGPVKVVSSS